MFLLLLACTGGKGENSDDGCPHSDCFNDANLLSPDANHGSRPSPFFVELDGLPYTHAGTTAASLSRTIDRYECAPDVDESGGEVWYYVGIDHPVSVLITVTHQNAVDVDLHLLVQGEGAVEVACLARGDSSIEVTIPPGTNFLVVDTPAIDGKERAGAYLLTIEILP